jgi:hypothetical protein
VRPTHAPLLSPRLTAIFRRLIEGFLLNHQLHWFSIRRFGTQDRFYNLDSCISHPQWISAMYLGLTLREAERQGASSRLVEEGWSADA